MFFFARPPSCAGFTRLLTFRVTRKSQPPQRPKISPRLAADIIRSDHPTRPDTSFQFLRPFTWHNPSGITLLRTLRRYEKRQLLCNQANPTRVGGTSLCGNYVAAEFGEFFMVHLLIRGSCGPFGVDTFYRDRFPGGLSRHIRVRFSAVLASANSAATFLSPRIRNRRIPRCSFKTPMTASANAFRRRYDARPVVEANLLRMRRRAG